MRKVVFVDLEEYRSLYEKRKKEIEAELLSNGGLQIPLERIRALKEEYKGLVNELRRMVLGED